MVLPRLTVLDERYAIRSVLGDMGPFDVTYLAWNLEEEEQVVVREYFPVALAARRRDDPAVLPRNRDTVALYKYGLERYWQESEVLQRIDHPNVVGEQVHFRANGTAYRICDYHPGATLSSVLDQQGGKISERAAISIVMPLLDGLRAGHRHGLLHGCISPKKIYLAKSGRPMLLGFQTARILLAQKSGRLVDIVDPGFSPPEQARPGARLGPWSDVYAMAATLFFMLTGRALPANEIDGPDERRRLMARYASHVSGGVLEALDHGLCGDTADRPSSIEAFRLMLQDGLVDASRVVLSRRAAPSPSELPLKRSPVPNQGVATLPRRPVRKPVDPFMAPSADEPPLDPVEAMRQGMSPARANGAHRRMTLQVAPSQDIQEARPTYRQIRKRTAPFSWRPVALVGSLLALTIVLAAAAVFYFRDAPEAVPDADLNRFHAARAKGDSLLQRFDLNQFSPRDPGALKGIEAAREYYVLAENYLQAQPILPSNADVRASIVSVRSRIEEIDEVLKRLDRAELTQEEYLEYMETGDSLRSAARFHKAQGDTLMARRFYADAQRTYALVLERRPQDSLATARYTETSEGIQVALTENRPSEEAASDGVLNEAELFTQFRLQGDSAYDEGDYNEALRKYQEALEFRPGDTYVAQRAEEARRRIDQAVRYRQYVAFLQQGDIYFEQGNYQEARSEYLQAKQLRPESPEVTDRILRIDTLFTQQRQAEEEYIRLMSRGDALLEQRQYAEARESFQTALDVRADDEAARQKIEEIDERLAQLQESGSVLSLDMVDEQGVYYQAEEPPEVIGGRVTLDQRLRYPEQAREAHIEGTVSVRMIVNQAGRIEGSPEIVRGLGFGTDEEVLRVLRGALFRPGRVGGNPVRTWVTMSFRFPPQ